MSDFEDGEIPSSPDTASTIPADASAASASVSGPYTPLERPPRKGSAALSTSSGVQMRPRSSTNSSLMVNVGDADEENDGNGGDQDDVDLLQVDSGNCGGGAAATGARKKSSATADGSGQSGDSDDNPVGPTFDSSSTEDSDYDASVAFGAASRSRKKKKRTAGRRNDPAEAGGNAAFMELAARYQDDRRRQGLPARRGNNVWGSILQEDALTSELNDIGVGGSLKDLDSDRGAETYNYILAHEHQEAMRQGERATELDRDLDDYFNSRKSASSAAATSTAAVTASNADEQDMETETDDRRADALQAGKKRSVKERLGERKGSYHSGGGGGTSDMDGDLSLARPDVPRTIADLDLVVLEGDNDAQLGKEIANKLSEMKSDLIIGVVEQFGRQVSLELFSRTQAVEARGGMMIKNGSRRRTPGGVFLQLLRDAAKTDARVDDAKVRRFFAKSNQVPPQGAAGHKRKRGRRNYGGGAGGNFAAELAEFQKFSKETKEKERRRRDEEAKAAEVDMADGEGQEAQDGGSGGDESPEEGELVAAAAGSGHDEERELKPLPDILTCISQKFRQKSTDSSSPPPNSSSLSGGAASASAAASTSALAGTSSSSSKTPKAFVEPEAPPNSVERTINSYDDDDDFLSAANCDTDDIEIF